MGCFLFVPSEAVRSMVESRGTKIHTAMTALKNFS